MITGKKVFKDGDRIRATYLGKFSEAKLLPAATTEIAFIGRSNSGKSSLLKALINADKMPQVSSTPGSTRLMHAYRLGNEAEDQNGLMLVDFPGYGYAKSSAVFRARFSEMLLDYLQSKRNVRALCLMMDCRRMPEDEELEIAKIARQRHTSLLLCLNKVDQLNQKELAALSKTWSSDKTFFEILAVSAAKRQNLDYLRTFILSSGS